MICLTYWFHNL